MTKTNAFRLVFSSLLVAVMLVGFAGSSLGKTNGSEPTSDCPLRTCPSNLSGFTQTGTCSIDHGFPFIEVCTTWRNSSNDACYKDTGCSWLG